MQFWSWKFQVAISRPLFHQCMLCKAGYALHINLHLRTPAQQRETSKVCSTLIHIAGTSHQKENLAFQAAEIFDRNTCNRKPEGMESGLNKNVPSVPFFHGRLIFRSLWCPSKQIKSSPHEESQYQRKIISFKPFWVLELSVWNCNDEKKTYPTVSQSFSGSMVGSMKTGNTIFKLKRASQIPSKFHVNQTLVPIRTPRLWAQCKRLQPGRKHPACRWIVQGCNCRTKVKDFSAFFPKKNMLGTCVTCPTCEETNAR